MIAEISSGNTDAADVFFLIAVIVFVLATLVVWVESITKPVAISATALGLAFVALGFLVL